MPSSLKDTHWLSSPLGIMERERIDRGFGKYLAPKARSFLDPRKEYRFFHGIKHWTLEVDGWCYELLPTDDGMKAMALVRLDVCKPHDTVAKVWHDFRDKHGIEPRSEKVGQTHMTHEEIMSRVDYIWKHFIHDLYILLVQNCQNFAKMLLESIATPADHPEVPDWEKALWFPIPNPVSYTVANISQGSLASGGSVGMTRLYLTAIACTPAETIEGGAAVGAIGTTATATATVEGGGSVSAAGGVASQTAGAGTAQTAACGLASQTAGTAQTAAVGTSHGTVAIAGGGKVGLGAKFSAATHGAGGAKAATLVKVGAAAALAHPVTAVGVIALGLLAAGKRDNGWIKRHKNRIMSELNEDSTAEISVSDVLLAEEALLEHAENSANLGDEVDEELAELAENLKLSLVTTEPAIMPDEGSLGDGLVSAGEDTKRSQTLA